MRPALPLGLRRLGGNGPRDATTPRGSATSAWPQRRAALNRSRLPATATSTPSGGLDELAEARRHLDEELALLNQVHLVSQLLHQRF
jgi:hypothetical protein